MVHVDHAKPPPDPRCEARPFECLLCGSTACHSVLAKPDVALVRCKACRLIQQSPLPHAVDYDARYVDHGSGYGLETLRDKHLFLDRDEALLLGIREMGAKGPLLDVGAGAGIMLEAGHKVGWKAIGLELSPQSAHHVRNSSGADVHQCSIEEAPIASGTMGVITFSHSLEHLIDPVRSLARAHELLRPGGVVHIAVPHWNCVKRWVAGRNIAWIFPEHICYFSRATLDRALRKAGFVVRDMRTRPMVCDVDFRFAVTTIERFGLAPIIRRFLRMKQAPLGSLLTDNVQISCPPWRFRFIVGLTRLLLRLWPERFFSALGLGEELRATAVRPA